MGGKNPRVLVLVETSTEYGRRMLEGIGRYALEHGPWSIYLEERGRYQRLPQWVRDWRGDGIIVRSSTPDMVRTLLKTGAQVIETDSLVTGFNLPLVYTNDAMTARMAADHFLERGLTQLAYCNVSHTNWSRLRREAFEAELAQRGLPCRAFELPERLLDRDWGRQHSKLAGWLQTLPRPVGILAENDVCGHRLLDTCRVIGLSVPEQVAVLGVDNDPGLCRVTSPALSSVDLNIVRIGYESAAVLARVMAGEKPPAQPVLVGPVGVVGRQSTDVLAVEDPDVAEALRYIREHACQGIDVRDVLREVPVSRRVLERRFRQSLGRTPKDEIRRVKLNRARELLAQTDLPIARVARQTGFRTPAYLANVFDREIGSSPREFRRAARSGSPAKTPIPASTLPTPPDRNGSGLGGAKL